MILKNANRNEKITLFGVICTAVVTGAALHLSGFSIGTLFGLYRSVLSQLLLETSLTQSLAGIIGAFGWLLIALISLGAMFSFLAAYGFRELRKKEGLIFTAAAAVIVVALVGVTPAAILLAIAIVVSGATIVPLAHTYGQELKRWIPFRTGSTAVSRALFIFNIIVALSVLLLTALNLPAYQQAFRSDLQASIIESVEASLPPGVDPATARPLILERVEAALNSPMLVAYMRWLPVVTMVMVWAVLEFLRLFLPYLAGAVTAILIKLQEK